MLQSIPIQTDLSAVPPPAPDHAGTLDEHVVELSALAARVLDAENCSITLCPDGAAREAAASAADGHERSARTLCSPLSIDGQLLGLIRLSDPKTKASFDEQDLNLLELLTLYVSRSIQVVQLRNVLKSRFAQLALMHDVTNSAGESLVEAAQHPEQMRRIIVKSFYREMVRAGFGPRQIVNAASEIIAELTRSLRRYSKRLDAAEKS
jgi:hypothetical protein